MEPIYLNIAERNLAYNNEHKNEINNIHESEKIQSNLQTLVEKVEFLANTMKNLSLYIKYMGSRNQTLNLLASKNHIDKSESFRQHIVLDSV